MTALALFWLLVTILTALLVALREVAADDPRRSSAYRPPRSHPLDPFESGGSTYR